MKITKATNYGFRTVIVVCHNPDDPEYIHGDDTAHPSENVNGCTDSSVLCRYNHRLQEFIWDGEEQYEGGTLRTAESFWDEICELCVSSPDAEEIVGLVGQET